MPGARGSWLLRPHRIQEAADATLRTIVVLAVTAHKLLWLVPNYLTDIVSASLAKLGGSHDVTAQIDACLIAEIEKCHGVSLRGVRFMQLANIPDRWVEWVCGRACAVTWVNTIYIPYAYRGSYYQSTEVCDLDSADTFAHELWHIHQFRRIGGGPLWLALWLWQYRKYGPDKTNMPLEVEATAMAAKFTTSDGYLKLRAKRCSQPTDGERGMA